MCKVSLQKEGRKIIQGSYSVKSYQCCYWHRSVFLSCQQVSQRLGKILSSLKYPEPFKVIESNFFFFFSSCICFSLHFMKFNTAFCQHPYFQMAICWFCPSRRWQRLAATNTVIQLREYFYYVNKTTISARLTLSYRHPGAAKLWTEHSEGEDFSISVYLKEGKKIAWSVWL